VQTLVVTTQEANLNSNGLLDVVSETQQKQTKSILPA